MFPEGCTTLEEVPWDLSVAISHAFSILGWHENRMPDKIPPHWMWPHDEELEKFFKSVDDRDESTDRDDEDGMFENEYAERFK